MEIMTILSHWLLILNSSCNILIYLQKDPKFKAVCWEMILTCLRYATFQEFSQFQVTSVPNFCRVPHIRSPSHQDDLDDSRGANGQTATNGQNGQTPMLTMATTTTTSNAPLGGGDSRVVVSMVGNVNNGDKR